MSAMARVGVDLGGSKIDVERGVVFRNADGRIVIVVAPVLDLDNAGYRRGRALRRNPDPSRSCSAQQLADLSVTQAEVEEGRQALLHDDTAEAQLHLSEAYRRGDLIESGLVRMDRAVIATLVTAERCHSNAGL
jgi:hypothetical protein